ncbi:MAG: hypothetical protein P8129_01265 [Anaerolineae bacterium]
MEGSNRESGELIEGLVRQIGNWKLTLPALLLFEIARPFSFIVGQGLYLCQPLLGFWTEEPRVTGYADLFSDRKNLDRLIARLADTQSGTANGGEGRG